MSAREIRLDPVTGETVVICEARRREERFPVAEHGRCPFCDGLADAHVLHRVGGAFAVPNQVPALRVEESTDAHRAGPYEHRAGLGAHEVLVESPDHAPLADQPPDRARDALRLARDRIAELQKDRRLRTISWSRTPDPPHHPLAELVALPFVPERNERIAARALHWRARHGSPLLADLVRAELDTGSRILLAGEHVLACTPFAPRTGFEVWFVPRTGIGRFADLDDPALVELADQGRAVARALAAALGPVPVGWALVGGAVDAPDEVGWHLRMSPRLLPRGGWEDATGVPMIGVSPESAASVLRRWLGR